MSDTEKPVLLTLLSTLTPLVIGALGIYFTNVYKAQETEANRISQDRLELERQQRLLLDKAAVVKQYFEYLANKADENQQQAALTVLASLGYTDLVIKVVATDPTPSNVQALAAIAATSDSEAANRAVGALEAIARGGASAGATNAAEQALSNTQAAQPSGTDNVAIVAGADKSLAAAQTEVDKLKAAGFDQAQVVKRGDWYRTVVPVKPEADSTAALNKIKSEVRQSAYSVDLKKWCEETPNGTECVQQAP
jgi:hypothetical protein